MRTSKYIALFLLAVLIGAPVLFAGCVSKETPRAHRATAGNVRDSLSSLSKRFSNIPLPRNYDLDRSKSFIYESGNGKVKVGRLHLTGWGGPENIINFYRSEMVKRGWDLIRVTEQEATIMLYSQDNQICTVVIVKSFGKTSVDIQFGPK